MSASSFLGGRVPRERLSFALEHGPEHLKPVFRAVRDFGCAWITISQGAGPFRPPSDKPCILIVGDDVAVPKGPGGFHAKSLRRYAARCSVAVVISCEAMPQLYEIPSAIAAATRRDVLIIESQQQFETDWIDLVKGANPEARLLVGAVRPPSGARH